MSRKSTAKSLFALASVLQSVAAMGARYQGNQHRAELEALKAENLRLRNQAQDIKNGQESNKVLIGDLQVELLKLRIAKQEWENRNKGIGVPEFIAQNYADPGDLRHGVMYKPDNDNPVNF